MGIFARFGDLIIKTVSFVGMLILSIPKIPEKLRNSQIREKIDTETVKGNISRIKTEMGSVKENYSGQKVAQSQVKSAENYSGGKMAQSQVKPAESTEHHKDSDFITISGKYTAEEKERAVLTLQIASAAFIVFSIFFVFNFLSTIIFLLLEIVTGAFVIYMLFNRVKKMYAQDFSAYRDFFLMYLAVGVIIALVSGNSSLVMAFSFQTLPSLSVLIYAIIAVVAVFLIFRIRYYRNYTFGTVLEAGKKTAHVKVEYDIRSNVKPDLYLVENNLEAEEGDIVKLKIEEKILSTGGNKPLGIMEVYKGYK